MAPAATPQNAWAALKPVNICLRSSQVRCEIFSCIRPPRRSISAEGGAANQRARVLLRALLSMLLLNRLCQIERRAQHSGSFGARAA